MPKKCTHQYVKDNGDEQTYCRLNKDICNDDETYGCEEPEEE